MFLRLNDPQQQHAVLIDRNEARREMFEMTLAGGNIALDQCFACVDEALAAHMTPELAIIYFEGAHTEDLRDLGRLRACTSAAVLALLEAANPGDIALILDAGADHVLPLGLQSDRFSIATVCTLAQARKQRQLEHDKAQAEHALADAKRIARAKMILMARHGIDESDAHRRVQKLSMERNLPLADMAGQIIDAESLLC
ncbi:MAG: ANTAR domain-containing protein [Pseudomonadota bacterium]